MNTGDRRLRPRKQPRQTRAELTRARILTAATHVFAEHGYAAGTTNRIAERARVSIGSLYQYFPNKDAILMELLTDHLDDGLAATERLLANGTRDPVETIVRTLVRTSIDAHRDDPALLQVLIDQASRSSELMERAADERRTRVATLRELLGNHPDVAVADTDIAARLAVSTLELTIHQLVAAPDPAEPGRLENEIVTMLTRYLTT